MQVRLAHAQEGVRLKSQVSTLLETSQKQSSHTAAAEALSAELEHMAQKRQRELQDCRASAMDAQQRHDVLREQLGTCAAKVAQSALDSQAALGARRSATQAAGEHEAALTAAVSAQADCAAHLIASQGVRTLCYTLSRLHRWSAPNQESAGYAQQMTW